MPRRKEPRIPDALLDQLLAGADAKAAFDPDGLLDDLKKALAERVLNAEMDHHLAGEELGNRRNGYGKKTVVTDTGKMELEVPRDRRASFDPQLIAKYQRRFPGFDDKIVSMYARGMSTREIVGHLRDLYGIEEVLFRQKIKCAGHIELLIGVRGAVSRNLARSETIDGQCNISPEKTQPIRPGHDAIIKPPQPWRITTAGNGLASGRSGRAR
jgi:hypothetical protein